MGSEPPEPTGSSSTAGFSHQPVMVHQVIALAAAVPAGTFLDATVGGAGHAAALLEARDDMKLLGLDRDGVALAAANGRLAGFGSRVTLRRARFDQLDQVFDEIGHDGRLSGFLFDLGVSSPQLDRAERGFSFRHDGPLDMRMDQTAERSADTVVNSYDQQELIALIRRNSDERYATRIAAAIVAARPLRTTSELADVIVSAIPAPARRRGGHPAKRTFQAIRIEVNDELQVLRPALELALDALIGGGRGLVLTYHSGEDRIVKHCFRDRTTSAVAPGLPRGLPVSEPKLDFRLVRPVARKPDADELASNPRSASARLRAIERLAA